ncbi:hypothetical protein GW915_10870 [bacterium]|nr:hypothetical protein [bacterium]
MKNFLCFILVLPCLAFSQSEETKYFLSLEDAWRPKKEAREKIELARETALGFLRISQMNLGNTFNEEEIVLLEEAFFELRDVPILLSSDGVSKGSKEEPFYDFLLCWERPAIMNTYHEKHVLRACKRSLFLDLVDLAEILVHEAFHLTGELDECKTTSLEIRVMNETEFVPHENGYVFFGKCKLKHLFVKGARKYGREDPFLDFFPKRFVTPKEQP